MNNDACKSCKVRLYCLYNISLKTFTMKTPLTNFPQHSSNLVREDIGNRTGCINQPALVVRRVTLSSLAAAVSKTELLAFFQRFVGAKVNILCSPLAVTFQVSTHLGTSAWRIRRIKTKYISQLYF